MGVGQVHDLQQALHTAIFAPGPVQAVEHDIRLHIGQLGGEVPVHIDTDCVITCRLRGLQHLRA